MKNIILTTCFVSALTQVINVSNAAAFLGIPGTPSLGDPLDQARAAERALKCSNIRNDANQHQKELLASEGRAQSNLATANEQIAKRNLSKNRYMETQSSLKQQENILADFQNIGLGLNSNENELKSSLYALHSRAADPELDETLSEMEAQTENASLSQLAHLVRTLMQKDSKELKSMLENKNSKLLLLQVSALISNSQVTIQKINATIDMLIIENETELSNWTAQQNQINAEINQIRGDYNAQEERKSCNF